MSAWFALLQFPLLYIPILVWGLAVYGSDFDGAAGDLALGGIVLLPITWALLRDAARGLTGRAEVRGLLLAGVLLAAWVYRPMHLGWWDEHSTSRAAGMAVLGVLSLLAALLGGARIASQSSAEQNRGRTAGWLGVAAVWAVACWYPMFAVMGVGAGLASAAILGTGGVVTHSSPAQPALVPLPRFALFLVAIELALPVYDWQTVPGWAPHIAWAAVAAAVGAGVARLAGTRAVRFVLVMFVISALIGGFASEWALHPLHTLVTGLALGAVLFALERPGARAPLAGASVWIAVGLIFAHLATQNLAYGSVRVLLLLPLGLALRSSKR